MDGIQDLLFHTARVPKANVSSTNSYSASADPFSTILILQMSNFDSQSAISESTINK